MDSNRRVVCIFVENIEICGQMGRAAKVSYDSTRILRFCSDLQLQVLMRMEFEFSRHLFVLV